MKSLMAISANSPAAKSMTLDGSGSGVNRLYRLFGSLFSDYAGA
jgi:hypothetical protein